MTVWYYSDADRNRLGPVAADDLVQLHGNGQLAPEVLVWREGLPDWKPWREVMDEVLGRAAPAAPVAPAFDAPAAPVATFAPAPATTAATATDANRARFALPEDAPGRVSNPYEIAERPAASPYAAPMAAVGGYGDPVHGAEIVYAGFWKRFAAYTIDSIVVGIAGTLVQLMAAGALLGGVSALGQGPAGLVSSGAGIGALLVIYLLPLALGAAYFGFFHASAHQASLGKMAVGIKVTDEAGGHISFWRGFGRYFGLIVSSLLLMVGLIMAAFTDRKRALHDMMCGTLVVDRWAFTAHPERQRHELGTVTIVVICLAALLVVGYVLLIGLAITMAAAAAG